MTNLYLIPVKRPEVSIGRAVEVISYDYLGKFPKLIDSVLHDLNLLLLPQCQKRSVHIIYMFSIIFIFLHH